MPTAEPPLRIQGRDPSRAVVLTQRTFLAPMEGITERVFRDLVVAEGGVGAACTEFLRITQAPVPRKVIRRDWRPAGTAAIGVQFMVADPQHLPTSIAHAEAEGAAFIDLNFGCPAPVVFNKCAGSALLDHPQRVGELVAQAVAATTLPVSAKIRAGVANVERLDDVIRAIADAGAAALSIHGRLRVQGYHVPATWAWIARAVTVRDQVRRDLPIIGNGSVDVATDAALMRHETGCDAIMIGRGALANPWIFREISGGSPGTLTEVAAFARAYGSGLAEACGERRAAARLKQFIKYVRAGGCFATDPDARQQLLRSDGLAPLLAWADALGNNESSLGEHRSQSE